VLFKFIELNSMGKWNHIIIYRLTFFLLSLCLTEIWYFSYRKKSILFRHDFSFSFVSLPICRNCSNSLHIYIYLRKCEGITTKTFTENIFQLFCPVPSTFVLLLSAPVSCFAFAICHLLFAICHLFGLESKCNLYRPATPPFRGAASED